jgi:hypothetical protein
LAQYTIVKVLRADPTTPAIIAPIIEWLRKFGNTLENQAVTPGKDKYAVKPMVNPSSQNKNIAILLDIFSDTYP